MKTMNTLSLNSRYKSNAQKKEKKKKTKTTTTKRN